jgi:hypothetical protein
MQTTLVVRPLTLMQAIRQRALLTVLAAFSLASCGGGGGDLSTPMTTPAPSSAAQAVPAMPGPNLLGAFGGTITGGTSPDLLFVVRDDGTKLGFYGTNTSAGFSVAGYTYSGAGSWTSGSNPAVYNGRDWGHGGLSVYVDATYDIAVPSLSGSIRSATESVSFAGGPIPGSSYNFSLPASVATVVGSWNMTDEAGHGATLQIAADGSVAGRYQACNLVGAVKPAASGLNVLSLQLSLDRASCPSRWQTLDGYVGFALAYPMTAGGTQLIVWAETNNGVDSDFVLASGRR